MALKVAGVVFLTMVCYAMYLVVVAIVRHRKHKPLYKIYRNSKLLLMTTSLRQIDIKAGDKVAKIKAIRRGVKPNPIDGLRNKSD